MCELKKSNSCLEKQTKKINDLKDFINDLRAEEKKSYLLNVFILSKQVSPFT